MTETEKNERPEAPRISAPDTNEAKAVGRAATEPTLDHIAQDGRRYFRFDLAAARNSGAEDTIPVIISEERIPGGGIAAGARVALSGQIRTHKLPSPVEGKTLLVRLFAQGAWLCAAEEADENRVQLSGVICRAPVLRGTPLGKAICDFLLGVSYADKRYAYIPCIAWGKNAAIISLMDVGERIRVSGRMQSREYTKRFPNGREETRTTYEVSVAWYETM